MYMMSSKVLRYALAIETSFPSQFLSGAKPRHFSTKPVLPVLTLYTKEEVCSLCDEAKAVLEGYKHRFHLEEVDITAKGNETWFDKYRYEIPVFHLNGSFLMKHRVNEGFTGQRTEKI
ncbi:hypothetical protein OS493_013717 [Desmophyllum pertusum]|uniref:Glutaredoxin-like protein n=1 Tax=Desmophyllum pertusum TaxID=174260 RepID=A0A9W9ZTH6_9CNID|nr:hypothetical protein OS493_013717 [Desmophyllum pertusum]